MQSGAQQFYFSAYFITNVMLLFAYPALRLFTSAGDRNLKHSDSFGFTYENSIIYTVLIMVIMGYIRATSLRGFFVDLFAVGKVGVAALLVFAKFKFSLIYIAICIIIWLVVPYPKYRAPNRFIHITSIQQFDQIINTSNQLNQSQKHKKNNNQNDETQVLNYQNKQMYFIQFYADWAMPCILNKQLWYSYSLKYTTQKLKFLQINVDRLPQLAKRYKINTSGFSKQLPSLVIVTNGQEQMRFPPVDENNKVSKVQKFDYKALLRYFDLQARYLQTRSEIRQQKGKQNKYD